MVDLKAMRVRGDTRGEPNEVNRQREPINQVMSREVEYSLRER